MFRVHLSCTLVLLAFSGVAEAQCSGTSSSVSISLSGADTYKEVPITVSCTGGVEITGVTVTFNQISFSSASPNLSDLGFVLANPGTTSYIDFLDGGADVPTSTQYNLTFSDSASGYAPNDSGSFSSNSTYKPTDYTLKTFPDSFPSPIGAIQSSDAASCPLGSSTCPGTATFTNTFAGMSTTAAAGQWTVYIGNFYGSTSGSISSITLNFTTATGTSTTTSLSADPNPGFTSGANSAVTLTASVSSGGGEVDAGTVTFYDGGSQLSCTGGNQTVSGGSATCTVTFTTQGTHSLTADYGGGGTFAPSNSTTYSETVDGHTTLSSNSLCNAGSISIPYGNPAASVPYPSGMIVGETIEGHTEPTLDGIIQKVTLTLNGLSVSEPESLGWMLVSPGGTAYEFMSNTGGGNAVSGVNLTFDDDASGSIPFGSLSSGIYKPTDDNNMTTNSDAYPSPAPGSFSLAQPAGTASLLSEFGGFGLTGTWQLYISNRGSTGGTLSGGWCMNLTMETNADATSTTVSGTPNPSTTGQSVAIMATVKDTSSPSNTVNAGTVTFTDGSTTLGTISVTAGTAVLSTTALAEGTHQIIASYNGSSAGPVYGVSSGNYDQRVNNSITESGTYSFCNTGAIDVPGTSYAIGPAGPYPSNITVTNLPGTVNQLTVSVNGFSAQSTVNDIESLLVAPTGANLDFFSNAGGTGDLLSAVNLTFSDSAPGGIPGSLGASGSYKPTSETTGDSYPQCPPNAGNCASPPVGPPLSSNPFTPSNYAQPAGVAILGNAAAAGVFGGTSSSTFNGNGQWSLYMLAPSENAGNIAIQNGWCLNFTENLPVLSLSKSHTGNFTQGQVGAAFTIVATNNGPGPTGGIATITDTMPAGLTPTGNSDGNWSCSETGQTATCTLSTAVNAGNDYPTLTLTANVSATASGTLNNHASVSGGGSSGSVNSNTDSIQILESTTTSASNATANFSESVQSVTLNASVSGNPTVNSGTVTFTILQGMTTIGTATTSGTVAGGNAGVNYALPAGLAAGTYTIEATYNPGTGLVSSSDSSHTLTVSAASTSTSASNASTNFSSSTQTVALTATVSSGAGAVNQGTVTFTVKNGGTTVGTPATSGTVNNGSAGVNYSLPASLGVGTYTIVATYNATSNFTSSSDSTHTLTVLSAGPALTVTSFSVLFGSQSYNVIGSALADLPWEVTGIQVVFSEPVASGTVNSLSGISATALAGLGTNTLTWTLAPTPIANVAAVLAASGPNAIMDSNSNPLNGGTNFSQALRILWGDVNGDGVVNSSDMVLTNNARAGSYNIIYDANGDGVVNTTDVSVVRSRINTQLP